MPSHPHALPDAIRVRGASEHNLKGVDVDIPRGTLTVVTGVSGSGKSSLAFDTICAEGRRRYLETFSSYARQFLGRLSRPAVARIDGLSPAVAVDQSAGVASSRSTVGTLTEIYDLLRLLWARAGTVTGNGQAPHQLSRALFSFNSPHGACPVCKGHGLEDRLDPDLLVKDPTKSVRNGALRITTPTGYVIYSQVTLDVLGEVCQAHGFSLDIPWRDLTAEQRDVILNGSERIRIPYGKHPLESRLRWSGITAKPREEGYYKGILPVMDQILRTKRNRNILRFVRSMPCRACAGTRLRPEALAVTYRGLSIAEAAALPITELRRFFENDSSAQPAAQAIGDQVVARANVLEHLGLGYLALDRESTTLSTGEAQRIRLARQASIGLSGLVYVLDEPSVGLHAHDTARLLDLLRMLRNRGNSVLVVEHDEQVMREADWIVDVGPAAGDGGGRVLFSGPLGDFTASDAARQLPALADSRTRAYLTGETSIAVPATRRAGGGELQISGITRHNLHEVEVAFALGAFNVVTGVSGAGKSTLVAEVVRRLGDEHEGLGHGRGKPRRAIDKIIHIDQQPIGRTPRSNPATYTGLFDFVRDLFAVQPEAVTRGFDKGRFSFNVKGGRCEACEGAGVQQIGMQFLGTVAIQCEVCNGRRFNNETLEVRYRGKNIHDVLEMPIAQAVVFFADQPSIARPLRTMTALGLGYLTLGQPATTLSGGEAQRVKLATELARAGTGRTLYVLDEPTTGLHAADVALLLQAIHALVNAGNTVLAIEHHLDVIKTADRVIDMGPGSGIEGGRVVAAGTPEAVAAAEGSLTGSALRAVLPGTGLVSTSSSSPSGHEAPPVRTSTLDLPGASAIRFTNVTTHNLRHVDVAIPIGRFTAITGVSGSGKSSLAFDTLVAEARQRYAETFSTWARRFVQRASDAEFDHAEGLTPAIAITQQAASRNPRSTVATLTEIHDLYRLMFARAGERPDPLENRLTASMFSPNSEHGACPQCKGLGYVFDCDPEKLITDPTRPLADGAMGGHKAGRFYGDPHGQHMAILDAVGKAEGLDFHRPWNQLSTGAQRVALRGSGSRTFDVEWHYVRGARRGVHRFESTWPGLQAYVRQEYERKHADRRGETLEALMMPVQCDACGGAKLRPEALRVRFAGVNISELLARTVDQTAAFFADLEHVEPNPMVTERAITITRDLREAIGRRLRSLQDAALGYLALDRAASTLSGGEAQRVRLASQIGSGLTGITYVLDEPTAGLHARDTARLVGLLRSLVDAGNTVVVVEHDEDVIAAADYVIELGPGAGERGGRIIAAALQPPRTEGRGLRDLTATSGSPAPPARIPRVLRPGIEIRGACVHNLRDIDVNIPAGGLVAIAGVSGSGKSSLVFDVLAPSLARARESGGGPVNCRSFTMATEFAGVVTADRGRAVSSPWSSVGTQTAIFDTVRAWFAATERARSLGLRAPDFSTTTKGGRCEACEGLGQVRVSMDFLPDVWTTCDECHGRRYAAEALTCIAGGKSIADVMEMSIEAAQAWLPGVTEHLPRVHEVGRRLAVLQDVGLGYLHVGQPVRTLSGGERQRLVLANALMQPGGGPLLYLLDEPTLGLHSRDVAQLLALFDRLVDAGHTVLLVEHHLDVVAHADWVIDLGPEGGPAGGRVVATGTPGSVALADESRTGAALRGRRRHENPDPSADV